MVSHAVTETLAANVRRQMEDRGWSQTELAERCKWPPARITEILQGKYDPRLGTVERIADAFGLSVPAILSPSPDRVSAAS